MSDLDRPAYGQTTLGGFPSQVRQDYRPTAISQVRPMQWSGGMPVINPNASVDEQIAYQQQFDKPGNAIQRWQFGVSPRIHREFTGRIDAKAYQSDRDTTPSGRLARAGISTEIGRGLTPQGQWDAQFKQRMGGQQQPQTSTQPQSSPWDAWKNIHQSPAQWIEGSNRRELIPNKYGTGHADFARGGSTIK